jgi:hypothetical protein
MTNAIVQMRTNVSLYALFILICAMWLWYHPAFASTIHICDQPMLAQTPTITLTPENPIQGGTYVISTAFTMTNLQTDITSGTEDLKVTLSGFPIVNEQLPLCDNVPCPIGNGFHNFSWNGDVPTGVHGSVLVSENWKMDNGSSILCFSVGYVI